MHNNPNCHFYGPQQPHYFQGTESGTNPSTRAPAVEVGTLRKPQQNSSGEDEPVMYNASIKVLNSNNKKDFTVYTLRSLSAEDFLTPDTLREEVFHQLGENVVSRKMDFCIGYFKRNVKIWINNNQDSKEAWETLDKVGKLTLWCIGIEKCGLRRGQSNTASRSKDKSINSSRKKRCDHTENEVHGSKK